MVHISVVIPFHNAIRVIDKSLNAVVPKMIKNDEVIVIDDNSNNKEEIKKLCMHYQIKHLRLESSSSFNKSTVMNKGIAVAANPWILELDQDKMPVGDYYFKNLRESLKNNSNYKIVRFGHILHHFPFDIKQKYIDKNGYATFNAVVGGNVCHSKKFFNEVGKYDISFDGNKGFQDFDLFYRMQLAGGKFLYLEDMLADHIDSHIKTHEMYRTNMDRFITKHGFSPEVD